MRAGWRRSALYVSKIFRRVAAFAIAYVGRHHGVEAAILNVILSTPVVVSNSIPTYLPTYPHQQVPVMLGSRKNLSISVSAP